MLLSRPIYDLAIAAYNETRYLRDAFFRHQRDLLSVESRVNHTAATQRGSKRGGPTEAKPARKLSKKSRMPKPGNSKFKTDTIRSTVR